MTVYGQIIYLLVKLKLPCRKIDCFDLTKDRKTAKEVRVTDMNLFKNSYICKWFYAVGNGKRRCAVILTKRNKFLDPKFGAT